MAGSRIVRFPNCHASASGLGNLTSCRKSWQWSKCPAKMKISFFSSLNCVSHTPPRVIHDELVKCIRGEADSPRVQHIPLWLEPVFSLAVVLTLPTTWTPSLGPFLTQSPLLQCYILGWWVSWIRFYKFRCTIVRSFQRANPAMLKKIIYVVSVIHRV